MNPHGAKVGCEVNVCAAKECNAIRMSFCALRIAFLERLTYLRKLRMDAAEPDLKEKYTNILRGMGVNE